MFQQSLCFLQCFCATYEQHLRKNSSVLTSQPAMSCTLVCACPGWSALGNLVMSVLNFMTQLTCRLEPCTCIHYHTPQTFHGTCPRGSDLWQRRTGWHNTPLPWSVSVYLQRSCLLLNVLRKQYVAIHLPIPLPMLLTDDNTKRFLSILSVMLFLFFNFHLIHSHIYEK